jgi:hypothetical protein
MIIIPMSLISTGKHKTYLDQILAMEGQGIGHGFLCHPVGKAVRYLSGRAGPG